MSVEAMTAVWECEAFGEVSIAQRLILLVIANAAWRDGVTWISRQTIVGQTRLAAPYVSRMLRELEEGNLIEIRKAQRGRKRVNVYRLMLSPLKEREVEYDRLPFDLAEPFTRSEILTSSPEDQVRTTQTTRSDSRSPTRARSLLGTVSSDPKEASLASLAQRGQPPKAERVDGRDLPFDALVEVCGIAARSPRVKQVATALNGARGTQGIRTTFWLEVCDEAEARGEQLPAGGEMYERALAEAVRFRAQLYRERFTRRVELTPLALAKWWTDVAKARDEMDAPFVPIDELLRRRKHG